MTDPIDSDVQQVLGIPRRDFVKATLESIPLEKKREAPNQAESLGMPPRDKTDDSVERVRPNERNLFLESSIDESFETADTSARRRNRSEASTESSFA